MRPHKIIEADFEIDKLTNSIENSITGEVFDTEVTRLYLNESKQIKRSEWGFEWHKEFLDPTKEIYKQNYLEVAIECLSTLRNHLHW